MSKIMNFPETAIHQKQIEQIYLEYKDKVFAYVFGKVSNRQDAEDIVSSVFVNVMNKFHTYDSTKASVSTWIYTITHNAVIDFYRRQKKHMEYTDYSSVSLEDMTTAGMEDEALLDSLADALMGLKPKERDLIILHYYKGYKLTEIATMMEMSYVNAKVIHGKAIKKIRESMSKN